MFSRWHSRILPGSSIHVNLTRFLVFPYSIRIYNIYSQQIIPIRGGIWGGSSEKHCSYEIKSALMNTQNLTHPSHTSYEITSAFINYTKTNISAHRNAATPSHIETHRKWQSVLPDVGKQQIRQRREKSRIHKDIDPFSQLWHTGMANSKWAINHPNTTLNTLKTVCVLDLTQVRKYNTYSKKQWHTLLE